MLANTWKETPPDMTNIVKGVEDALNKIAYKDDKSVCRQVNEKFYGPREETRVWLWTLPPRKEETDDG